MACLRHLIAWISGHGSDFSPISILASLTCTNKAWNVFIDSAHQDAIYGSLSKISRPYNTRDLSSLNNAESFAKYFDNTASWKDLCKRQTLLERAWNSKEPITRESIIQIGNDAVWRFRPDFTRRFILSTSQQGGMNVTDMDSGSILWRLPNDKVRPFAHLEYLEGTAVFDREGNALEVWRTDIEGSPRGTFERVAILPHQYQTRGFQLAYNTLCVVSTEGRCFVYDMLDEPRLRTVIAMEEGAVGHLDQSSDVVLTSMGKGGYFFYDKMTGGRLGSFHPKLSTQTYHIRHPPSDNNDIISTGNAFDSLPSVEIFPPRHPSRDRLVAIDATHGPLPRKASEGYIALKDDEWGAALFSGPLMAGISRGGRLMMCTDWRACLHEPKLFDSLSYIVECESDGQSFDLGGWLSFRNDRIMFEVNDRVYVLALNEDGRLDDGECSRRKPSYAFTTSSSTQLAVPVSFMQLTDDGIMTTYTTLGWRRRTAEMEMENTQQPNRFRIFPTKTIRVLSLAPVLGTNSNGAIDLETAGSSAINDETHANILEIMDMLSADEDGNDDSDSNDDDDSHNDDADGVW